MPLKIAFTKLTEKPEPDFLKRKFSRDAEVPFLLFSYILSHLMQEKDINLIQTNEFGTILGTAINQLNFSKKRTIKLHPFHNSLAHERIRLHLMTNRLFS